MRSWLFPTRATEATPAQVVATGAAGGAWGTDPLDDDRGWKPAGSGRREVPPWTQEKSRIYSVAAYRANPMARAIIDTYTSFCVGDSGVSTVATNAEVGQVVAEFWNDPRNRLGDRQEAMLRDQLLTGETLLEMMTGTVSGVTRFSPIDTTAVTDVLLEKGNPLWPRAVVLGAGEQRRELTVAQVDDSTGLRDGEAMWWTPFKALMSDRRGQPFLEPVLDWLDSYDTVLSNLIDRTALARYLVWDVTVDGGQEEIDAFVRARGGLHVPRSGGVEVHNAAVKWEAKNVQTGAYEDSAAAKAVLTLVAGGTGLAKTWLAEPEDANRATSLTMAEPVRRRVAGVQKVWLGNQTEMTRYAVDKAVAARRLPETVTATDPKSGTTYDIPACQSVMVTGPEVAAADAQITAQVLLNLSTGLEKLVATGALSTEAAQMAARRAWEDYVGVPYHHDLDSPEADRDDIATHIDDTASAPLRAVT
ncbi:MULTISPECIES: hypothetical protein [unclassified Crossiella]|uniref:hypothetical protein n=1 Tax=unclassified Crossiella TaxID=2620835 RepID=UPI001FFF3379|nr:MULTISPECIES: hypothetical protein [unclassified Crossiella]MCK2242153.1 hypothetical protein [Crossiella sp. S99.2]MCK2256056.1 hypothetical protein [Crossiella sp. S99.1]